MLYNMFFFFVQMLHLNLTLIMSAHLDNVKHSLSKLETNILHQKAQVKILQSDLLCYCSCADTCFLVSRFFI